MTTVTVALHSMTPSATYGGVAVVDVGYSGAEHIPGSGMASYEQTFDFGDVTAISDSGDSVRISFGVQAGDSLGAVRARAAFLAQSWPMLYNAAFPADPSPYSLGSVRVVSLF